MAIFQCLNDREVPTTLAQAAAYRSELEWLEFFAAELVRRNEELLEENRQMRAALAVWAETAATTCLKCVYRPPEAPVPLKGFQNDLVELSGSLLKSLHHNAL